MTLLSISDYCKDSDYKNYFGVLKRVSNLSCQRDFLAKCIENGKLPKGILDQSKFVLSFDDDTLKHKCQQLYYFAASRTLDLIHQHIKSKTKRLQKLLGLLTDGLHVTKPCHELANALDTLKKFISKFTTNIKLKQTKKFSNLPSDSYIPDAKPVVDSHILAKNSTVDKSENRSRRKRKKKKSRPSPDKKRKLEIRAPASSTKTINTDMIINLSTFELENKHKELLTLGESFAPTPGDVDLSSYYNDIDKFANNLRCPVFFANNPTPSYKINEYKDLERSILTEPSNWVAPKTQNHSLELYIGVVTKELKNPANFRKSYDNLVPELRGALKELIKQEDIIVRKFDKGQGWIIDNTVNYVDRMENKLQDESTFCNVTSESDIICTINSKIYNWLETYSKFLTNKICSQIISINSRPGFNYGNYKAHKPAANYPLRMITSGCGSPIQILSCYVEYHLKPLVSKLPNVMIDTSHFLRTIDDFNSSFTGNMDDVLLVSWDIKEMYPSIDNEMGVAACRRHLDSRTNPRTPTDCIIDALTIVLENNVSFFNNQMYKQVAGTAMGPSHACSYADLAMSDFDTLVTNNTSVADKLKLWLRFRDDIFTPWIGTVDELHNFTEWLNSINPKIRFTLESHSTSSINYLDCVVFKSGGRLCTRMYHKPSDTFAYMSPKSCHPPHIARNIPYGIAVRVRRVCSSDQDFDNEADFLTTKLVERGYNENFVTTQFDRSRLLDRKKLFTKTLPEETTDDSDKDKLRSADRCFPLVTDYNPKLPNISSILYKYKFILELDQELCKIINPKKIFGSFRRCKTLSDLLVHSRFPAKTASSNDTEPGSKSCAKCSLCIHYLVENKEFTSPYVDKTFYMKTSSKCTDEYIIYLITINNVAAYVGRTENSLRTRWACHKSHMNKNYRSCNVSCYMNNPPQTSMWVRHSDESLSKLIRVQIIDKVEPELWDTADTLFNKLCRKEKYWQCQLKTTKDFGGLNDREERVFAQNRCSKK